MTEFLVDNMYVRFGGQLCRQIVGIPVGTNCAPLLAAYGVYASQLIRYACCSNYSDFLSRHRTLVTRLLSPGYKVNRLSNTFKKSMADTLI